MSKAIFVDTSRCTACRGCQVGCKEWKNLPPVATKQWGSHQNPPDLNAYNFKLVRFSEHLIDNTVAWYFFPDQCRHCLEAPCQMTASSPDAIIRDLDGAGQDHQTLAHPSSMLYGRIISNKPPSWHGRQRTGRSAGGRSLLER